MEGQESYLPETVAQTSGIHFEPGIHPRTESDAATVYNDFSQGNLDAHGWNTEVGERIASYAYTAPALLLTIDGLSPVPQSPHPLFTSLQEAGIIWTHVPARPNKLNHTGQVYVVKGDIDYDRLPQTVLPDVKESVSLYQQTMNIEEIEGENANQVHNTAIAGETAGIAALGAALWGARKLLSPSATNANISRRQFLRKSLAVATSVATAGSLLRLETPNITASVPNEPTKEFLQTVDNIIRPRLARSTYVDGRTALLLAKAEDAQATLSEFSQATNAVVMGSLHADIASTYIQDKSERSKAITAYAQELLEVARQVYGSYRRFIVPTQHFPSH